MLKTELTGMIPPTPSNKELNAPFTTNHQSLSHRRLYSEASKKDFAFRSFSSFDYIQQMLKEIRRISPTFTLNLSQGSLQLQILQAFKQSIDHYLKSYVTHIVKHQKSKSQTVKETVEGRKSEKNSETVKQLLNFERVLKLKEEKIAEKLNEVEFELFNLKKLSEGLENDKEIWFLSKSQEQAKLENDRDSIVSEQLRLEQVFDKLKESKIELDERENSLNELSASLSQEKNQLLIKKIELNKAAWEQSKKQSDLESQQSMLNLKLEHFAQEKAEFEKEKSLFSKESHKKIRRMSSRNFSKTTLPKLQIKSSPEYDKVFNMNDISPLNASIEYTQSVNLFESRSGENGKDFDLAYIELNEEIERINKDLELREQAILTKEQELSAKNLNLNQKLEQIEIIEQCLRESKIYLDEFNEQTVVELEYNSNELLTLIHSLKARKSELEVLIDRVHKELRTIKNFKSGLDIIEEEPDNLLAYKSHSDLETIANTLNSDSD